jgi:hypothetical protein
MGATVTFLCEKVVVPAAVHPQAVPAARAASVSIKLRAAADFTTNLLGEQGGGASREYGFSDERQPLLATV